MLDQDINYIWNILSNVKNLQVIFLLQYVHCSDFNNLQIDYSADFTQISLTTNILMYSSLIISMLEFCQGNPVISLKNI